MTLTKKTLALALLALTAHADASTESPWATGNHFSAEIAGGAATMGGSPYSASGTLGVPTEIWNFGTYQEATSADLTLSSERIGGYKANWHQMMPSANRLGFAGQLNLHYMAVEGHFAGGIYGGVGYNGAHSSSAVTSSFDRNTYVTSLNLTTPQLLGRDKVEIEVGKHDMTGDAVRAIYVVGVDPFDGDVAITRKTTQDPSAPNAPTLPAAKATVSSGLMFQAGTRLGAMIGNVFPHLRVGWATYQLKAHMTNQYAPSTITKNVMLTGGAQGVDGAGGVLAPAAIATTGSVSGATAFDSDPAATALTVTGLGGFGVLNAITVSSKGSKWANALTLGAGVDWAFQKMTLGFYYQAAICQRVTFDKWNKDVTQGVTETAMNLTGVDPLVAPLGVAPDGGWDNAVADGRARTTTYGKAIPKVSISPVIHTVMASIKYVISKA